MKGPEQGSVSVGTARSSPPSTPFKCISNRTLRNLSRVRDTRGSRSVNAPVIPCTLRRREANSVRLVLLGRRIRCSLLVLAFTHALFKHLPVSGQGFPLLRRRESMWLLQSTMYSLKPCTILVSSVDYTGSGRPDGPRSAIPSLPHSCNDSPSWNGQSNLLRGKKND